VSNEKLWDESPTSRHLQDTKRSTKANTLIVTNQWWPEHDVNK